MKKQAKMIETNEFIIDERDARIIIECLNYCAHRLTKHGKCGIRGMVSLDKINKLRKEFGVFDVQVNNKQEKPKGKNGKETIEDLYKDAFNETIDEFNLDAEDTNDFKQLLDDLFSIKI